MRAVKKKFEDASDQVGSVGFYWVVTGVRKSYAAWTGFWLNRRRSLHRQSFVVAYGAGIALGLIEPDMEYYRSVTDGEGEALLMKAQHTAAKRSRDG